MGLIDTQNVVIRRAQGSFQGDKRQHLPFIVEWTCDECGERRSIDYLTARYLSYPDIPGAKKHWLYCESCDHDTGPFTIRLDMTMTLEDRDT